MAIRIIPTFLIIVMMLSSSCKPNENEKLKAENDSLRRELETRHSMVVIMNDVKSLIDSIDQSRKVLNADLNEGTSYENFSNRLKDINKYVKQTQDKISRIQQELKSTKKETSAYLMMVTALQTELQMRVGEVESLEAAVEQFKSENKGLMQTVKLQETAMADLHTKIEAKQQELALLQAKVEELVKTFKVSEAEAYYARAKSVEEAARRTRLAPHKKRETYREALELYKKALSLGKQEAKANIAALEKKIR